VGTPKPSGEKNPWRRIFEDVRRVLSNKRDASGVVGSINWLRKQMALRGANPNVVRNIIYRDKGKLADKRVLFDILSGLWEEAGQPPLRVPELEVLLAASSEGDQEVMQLLGREKRRAYGSFVSGVRSGQHPKLLVTGRPGSGKTLLVDYVQQALELPPRAAELVLRQEFSPQDLAASLSRLALSVGVPTEVFEARLVKIGVAGAFSVQADAQADVARVILERLRGLKTASVMLLHVSQSASGGDALGNAPLRLNTPEVPRVNASEWLWHTLFEPMSRLPNVSLLVTMADVPASVLGRLGAFEGPIKLNPPTANEARRFVKARAQHLPAEQQEALVQRARRSFEDLRTLTLLAEVREPLPEGAASPRHVEQLSQLAVTSGDARLRDFLGALAVLSLPEFPAFEQAAIEALRSAEPPALSSLEAAFLDAVPGEAGCWRPFSRQLARALRRKLRERDPSRYRELSRRAAHYYERAAHENPKSDLAARYLHHLFEARAWEALVAWAQRAPLPQSLLQRVWHAAQRELGEARETLEAVALHVAAHYVKLGSFEHPDVVGALEVLASAQDPKLRAWTALKRAEGAILQGRFEHAEALIGSPPAVDDPVLSTEVALLQASIARWRSQLDEAAALTERSAQNLTQIPQTGSAGRLLHVKVAVWAGLIAKDRGDLTGALAHFERAKTDDDLLRARLAFQRGDVHLALGHFDLASGAFDEAVLRARQGEAPAFEQARYAARRGTLLRRRGELERAEESFAGASGALAQEEPSPRLGLEVAKVEDERALLLLAQGRFDEAILTLQNNVEAFERYEARYGVDASFRVLRSTLRLSLAYWCRALGQPLWLPLSRTRPESPTHPDLLHAQGLLRGVFATLQRFPARYQPLCTQAYLAASLLDPPAEAVRGARGALSYARYPYQEASAHAYLAGALLRAGDLEEVPAQLERAQGALCATVEGGREEGGDHGLQAQLTALRLRLHARKGEGEAAAEVLERALGDPQLSAYHEALLRTFGEAAEGDPSAWLQGGLLRRLGLSEEALEGRRTRLPDVLAAQWGRREGA